MEKFVRMTPGDNFGGAAILTIRYKSRDNLKKTLRMSHLILEYFS